MSRLNQTLTNMTLLKNILKEIYLSNSLTYKEKDKLLKDFNKMIIDYKKDLLELTKR